MSRHFIAALAVSSFLIAPHVAHAATIDATGATALQTMLQKKLDAQKASYKMQGLNITTTGDLKIETKGTYYAVTYPRLAIDNTTIGKVDVGVITMNVMPGDKDKEWKMSVALPTPIRFLDASGKEEARMDIGSQKLSMIINEAVDLPKFMDLDLKNLVLADGTSPFKMSIDNITGQINYTEDAQNFWSGPSSFSAKGFKISGQDKDGSGKMDMSIGDISMTGNVQKMDMNAVSTFQSKMKEITDAGFDPAKGMSPEAMDAFWSVIMQYGLQQADALKGDLAVSDIKFSGTEKDGAPIQFGIGKLGYGLEMADMRADKTKGSFHLNMANVTPTGIPAEYVKYTPQTINFNFGFKDLPFKELMTQLGTMAKQGADMSKNGADANPQAQMMGMQAMMTIPALLGKAGTVFTLDNTNISTANYALNLDGQYASNAQALFGGTGKLKAVFAGMDQLITDLQAMTQAPSTDPKVKADVTQALQGLAMAQMMGQQGTDASGKPARIFDFQMNEAGGMTLNGADLSTMMGGAPGGAPMTPPPGAMPAQAPSK